VVVQSRLLVLKHKYTNTIEFKPNQPSPNKGHKQHPHKMSIPNEKLQQLLQEIQSKAQFAEQQLVLVRQQMQSQTRKKRMLELSTAEIDALPQETRVYNGVGKM
jgi:hypothetical protein